MEKNGIRQKSSLNHPDPEFEAGIKEFELTLDEECAELDIDI